MDTVKEVDSIWRVMKTWGRFQVFQLCVVVLDMVPAVFTILSAVFTGYMPDYECDTPTVNDTNQYSYNTYKINPDDKCKYDVYITSGNTSTLLDTQTCTEYTYAESNSYATEWNLVCKRANLAALAQSLVLAGQGIGALTMSHLADRFGRKKIHVISHLGVMLTMLVMTFSPNILVLSVLRLVAGTFQQGIVCTGKVMALEMFPREVRAHMEAITFLAWTGGMVLLALYGYAFQGLDWRYLQIGMVIFSLYAVFEWWFLEESVRWLLSNGRTKEAERILRKAARWNKVDYAKVEAVWADDAPMPVVITPMNDSQTDSEKQSIPDEESDKSSQLMTDYRSDKMLTRSGSTLQGSTEKLKKYTVIDILKNPKLRINTLILWYAWIVATGTYYGLTLVSSHLAGDHYLNFFLSGLVEMPGLIAEFWLFNKIGRKKTMILWYATAGIALISSTALMTVFASNSAVKLLANGLSLIGKMAATGMFSTVFLYTPEIYPTNYRKGVYQERIKIKRNSGLGIASSVSRIGGILAPFASNLALIALWIPGAIFGGMCLMVTLLALRLPESASHELPTTIAECNAWEKSSTDVSSAGTDSEMAVLQKEQL